MNEQPKCTICGEPLNPGQEMFRFHGSDGLDCPKPPLPKPPTDTERMNWLALHPRGAQIIVDGVTKDCLFYGISLAPGVDLRSAIDTMMRASANA